MEQAEHLASLNPKRPRQADLRRAISAAYYALFHFLIAEATQQLMPRRDHATLRHVLGRAFQHGEMRSACENVQQREPAGSLRRAVVGSELSGALRGVAAAFVELQKSRHEADYNTAGAVTLTEASACIRAARDAIATWATLRGSTEARAFLLALMAHDRLRRF